MTQPEYNKAKQECWHHLAFNYHKLGDIPKAAFDYIYDRAYAFGKQEKDAEKKTSALTDKEVYALESAISELESLMDGTLDEDYHKEQKNIIKALKRIIKKNEKK